MAALKAMYDSKDPTKDPGLSSNFDVDYVIHYKFPENGQQAPLLTPRHYSP